MSVFTRFDRQNDVVENQKVKVSSGIFSGGSGTLQTFFTVLHNHQQVRSYTSIIKFTSQLDVEIQFDVDMSLVVVVHKVYFWL